MDTQRFDAMAKRYDTGRREERADVVAEEIRACIGDGSGLRAMEYGCGTGLVGTRLLDFFGSIVFMDSSQGMIAEVERKLAGIPKEKAVALRRDLLTEVCEDTYGCIFTSLALHHIADTRAILSRFYEALDEGGALLVVELEKDDGSFHAEHPDFHGPHGFDAAELRELALAAGFSRAECQRFYHGSKTVKDHEADYSLIILDARK